MSEETIKPTTTRQPRTTARTIPPEGKATVTETKTKTYIEDKPNENNEFENEMDFDETLFNNQVSNFQEQVEIIPKSKLEIMFDSIREIATHPNESFYAMVLRQPDFMEDSGKFNVPCSNEQNLGTFQFTANDLFNFSSFIQKIQNSGGRFNIRVYNNQRQPARVTKVINFVPRDTDIGLNNFFIPNPVSEQTQNANNTQNDLLAFADKLIQNQNQQFERLAMIMQGNQQPQRTLIDSLNELKLVKELTEPPPPKEENQGFSILKNEIYQAKIIEKVLKDEQDAPKEDKETNWMDLINNPQAIQAGAQLVGVLMQGLGNIAVALKNQNPQQPQVVQQQQPPIQHNPANLQPPIEQPVATNENLIMQQEMFTTITTELERVIETGETLTLENPVLVDLSRKYAAVYPMIVMFAKSQPFDNVWQILTEQILTDEIAEKYFDEQGDLNELGIKVKGKIQELYELWKNS